MRPALPGSIGENRLHETGKEAFFVVMHDGGPAAEAPETIWLARAIGGHLPVYHRAAEPLLPRGPPTSTTR